MAASGTYNITTANQYISGYVSWTESNVNINNNTSDLTMNVYLHRTNTYSGTPTQINNINLTRTFYIGNETISTTQRATITIPNDHSYVLVASTTKSGILHNSDGSLSLSIGFAMSAATGTTGFTVSRQNSTATLTTIPRTSVLNSVTINLTNNTIAWNLTRYSSSFTDNLVIYSGNNSFIVSGVSAAGSQALTSAQLSTLYTIIGTATSATVNGYIQTYNGGTLVGNSNVVAISVTLPSYSLSWTTRNCVDNISTYNTYKNNSTDLIANLSNPKLTFAAASSTGSNYGRTIAYTINNESATSPKTYTNYTGQSFTVKASDGRTSKDITWTPTNTVIPYKKPTLNAKMVRTTPTASTATVTLNGTYYDGNGLTSLGSLAISFRYTEQGEDEQTINTSDFSISSSTSNHIVSFTATASISDLDYTKSISYIASMSDLIGVSPSNAVGSIPRGLPVWNSYVDNNNVNHFNINGKLHFDETNTFYPLPYISLVDTTEQTIGQTWEKIAFNDNYTSQRGDFFTFDSTNNVIVIPQGVKKIKVWGVIGGKNAAWVAVYCGTTTDISIKSYSQILVQPSGNTHFCAALPVTIVDIDAQYGVRYVGVKAYGYDSSNSFIVNGGFTYATRLYVELLEMY